MQSGSGLEGRELAVLSVNGITLILLCDLTPTLMQFRAFIISVKVREPLNRMCSLVTKTVQIVIGRPLNSNHKVKQDPGL